MRCWGQHFLTIARAQEETAQRATREKLARDGDFLARDGEIDIFLGELCRATSVSRTSHRRDTIVAQE